MGYRPVGPNRSSRCCSSSRNGSRAGTVEVVVVVVAVPVAVSDVAEVDFVYTCRSSDISGVSMISVEEEEEEVVVVAAVVLV